MKRFQGPLIRPETIPPLNRAFEDVSSVFNPGAVASGDRDLLLLRVQDRGRRTHLLPAWHDLAGGIRFADRPLDTGYLSDIPATVYHAYDPRITRIDDRILVTLALDTDQGCHSALLDWSCYEHPELVGVSAAEDLRNCVLFPRRVDGRYLRLSRPNQQPAEPGNPASGQAIRLDESRDLVDWSPLGTVAAGRPRYWDEWIGAGPPPILTEAGWLVVYHGVATHFASSNIYQAGVLLLDRDNPAELIARSPMNFLEPRQDWERTGQVPNVVFPSGLCVSGAAGRPHRREDRFRLYYGAADTVTGLLEGRLGGLLDTLEPG